MSIEDILEQINFWENEADSCEEGLENAVSHYRYYYKLLDEAGEVENG